MKLSPMNSTEYVILIVIICCRTLTMIPTLLSTADRGILAHYFPYFGKLRGISNSGICFSIAIVYPAYYLS